MLASMACYTGQIPGFLEATAYYTPTPLPVDEYAQFDVLETVLAPEESGQAFFFMTEKPEALLTSKLNSKSLCEMNSAADILYAGRIGNTENGTIFLNDYGRIIGDPLPASNGLVHVVNVVLYPEDLTSLTEQTNDPIDPFELILSDEEADGTDEATESSTSDDIIGTLERDGRFTLLLQALQVTGLDTQLQSGEFTLLAPIDTAFVNELAQAGMQPADAFSASNAGRLTTILEYHV
ncbi:MAG: hypothetical protein GYB65_08655, partial [Chloroflexi bacterium]|nr:hypothetical protein [Chloroflexota bacterium]